MNLRCRKDTCVLRGKKLALQLELEQYRTDLLETMQSLLAYQHEKIGMLEEKLDGK